ncbi:uncharacterized protein SPPG_08381 [Spizellomyces punctatus DAOM BR117]|uniref:SHSP domain-containing protein n=1 Tax=Spizellomyces punctatus (strain DAOM BR117) TaxID=645134 RepID=A0A0L0H687_SPIPD|nr:uncharacterized protein SPPG_08381 [Spizellomyces punctatus DAOM BR117]KNC96228.1 hypothetical protein SPPG_08381 [Spizellomyces punctatus DAOM BR117]|eukprot:XP_016604268.1 hypothetical protein SPPG_08381 [Spizellomyces punctatus DAOM BR117]
MSLLWNTDPLFNDPFFRTPFPSLLDGYVRSIMQPTLMIGDADSTNQEESTDLNNQQVSTRKRRDLDTFLRGPRVDVTETDKEYVIKADLPGLSKSDVQIHVSDGALTLEGERKHEHEEKTDRRHVVERSFGKFSRRIRLPPDAQVDNAKATMENGVLQIALAKKAPEKEEKKLIALL